MSVIVCKTLLENSKIEVELKWKKAAFLMGGTLGCCHWKRGKLRCVFQNIGGKDFLVGEGGVEKILLLETQGEEEAQIVMETISMIILTIIKDDTN